VVVAVLMATGLREVSGAGLQEAMVERQLAGLNLREEPQLRQERLAQLFKAVTQPCMVDQVEVGFLGVEVALMVILMLVLLVVLVVVALGLPGEPLRLLIKALGQHRR